MPNDLISLYCKGTGKRFLGVPCDHYERFTDKCRLLRQGKTAAVFDQGRCEPAEMLISAVARHVKALWYIIIPKAHQQYAGDRQKYKKNEYIDFISGKLLKKLRDINLEICTLPGLAAYISKASRNEIISIFSTYPRKKCGECQFLSLSKPCICQKSEEHQKRVPSDKKCDDFRPVEWEFVPIEEIYFEDLLRETQIYIKEMQVLLGKRTEEERDKHAKKRYQRQHTVFMKYAHLLGEGESPTRARKQIADMLGKDEKTIRNDIKDISAFFKKEFLKS